MGPVLAWHFVNETLRDGRPVPRDGEVLRHNGPLIICRSGLHASVRIIDATSHAPGHIVCRVRCDGQVVRRDDKLVCSERIIMWRVDADALLRAFSEECARSVHHRLDAQDLVSRFLGTEDKTAAVNAWAYARTIAWAAARDAAARADVRTTARTTSRAYSVWADAALVAARADARADDAWASAWDASISRSNGRLQEMVTDEAKRLGVWTEESQTQ